jgi:hypothetical protein
MRIVSVSAWGLALSLGAIAVACGSSNGNGNSPGGDDGGPFGTSSSGGSGGSSSGGTSSSSGGGSSGCPIYQAECNGKCIPTGGDPTNCGGCGVTCTANQVCVSNACAAQCPATLTKCGQTCADTQSDNANCGGCGHACPSGQGCANGGCVPAVPLGPPPAKCVNGGPPINFGGADGGVGSCAGNVAQTTFTWALCSCTDVNVSDILLTDAYDSTKGPYPMSKGPGGGVGLDRTFNSSSTVNVGGALWASAANGLTSSGDTTVGEELHVGGQLNAQLFTVGYDGFVNGAVSGSPATFDKNLTVPNGVTPSGTTVKGQILHVPPPISVPPPCDCTPSKIIPVSNIVANFKTNNDNALIGLNPAVLSGPTGTTRLDLPCGYYYLDSIQSSVPVTIVAHGNTALFIGGDIAPSSGLVITLDPTAQLDLLVGGTINTSDTLQLGNVGYPALMRTYVGSSTNLTFSSGANVASNLYAANALVDWSADTAVYGSVFAGNFNGSSAVTIHYDSAVLNVGGSSCGPPPSTCMTCGECGNQACVNNGCGACTNSSQCCAPLICQAGKCVQSIQ